ncbi:MAG: DUF429 domain-containing protein [Lentisphaeria bacterium]|nr:DUF429 domain-containing protein [Lentisphaeria bacterium]
MRILGVDPAWTWEKPSGIALIEQEGNDWKLEDIAPSFDLFYSDKNIQERFQGKIVGGRFDLKKTLEKSGPVDCIVVDMPISAKPFFGRRKADNAITEEFGKAWCATHTPTAAISKFGVEFVLKAKECGYILNTNLIETYPHPAILSLIPELDKRLPYKVGKRKRYWPEATPEERRDNLYENLQRLRNALSSHIRLPEEYNLQKDASFTQLKRFEDTLDALVCAWVGIKFKNGLFRKFGDEFSYIMIPE